MGKQLGGNLRDETFDKKLVVEELALAQRSHVQDLRTVVNLRADVMVQPADSAARGHTPIKGSTRELRTTSVVAVFAGPVAVGSFFHLAFASAAVDLPTVFARCDRCTLLHEDQFEVRFRFLSSISLPDTGPATGA